MAITDENGNEYVLDTTKPQAVDINVGFGQPAPPNTVTVHDPPPSLPDRTLSPEESEMLTKFDQTLEAVHLILAADSPQGAAVAARLLPGRRLAEASLTGEELARAKEKMGTP